MTFGRGANHDDEHPETESPRDSEKSAESPREAEKSDAGSTSTTEDHSPRSVLEAPVSGPDSDNSGSSTSESSRTDNKTIRSESFSGQWSQGSQWKSFISVLKKKSMKRLSTFPPLMGSEVSKRNLNRKLARLRWVEDGLSGVVSPEIRKTPWRCFDYEELAAATDNFSPERLIGKGGHAEVYKGCLLDGELVAVKRLIRKEGEEERVGDFLSELGIIAHIDHPNAARLLGFGVDRGLHLVLQFSPHGSLASLLHGVDLVTEMGFGSSGSKEILQWGIRFKVAQGVAEGLLYLHHCCHRRIIHRDIKASNILLTHDFKPQISDFGLAKWLPQHWTHHIVFPIEGTFGYLAPEYFMHGIVDEKTDVFAYGVLLLELLTGRRAVDSCRQSLVMWAKPLLEAKNIEALVDPSLQEAYDPIQMKRLTTTASMCIHHVANMRPHMNQVVQLLKGEDGLVELPGKEAKPVAVKALLLDTFDLEDYTRSNYLRDLNRHKQLALE